MQIISIHLKNIKSHRDTHLDFASGINVLSGANGVGKSTVFEAIGYALFGVDAQSFVGNVERFITIGAKKGEISVIFQSAENERFRVSRTVGTPANWLLAREIGGDFEVEEHKDIKETEARLKELLGLDNGRALSEQFELVIGPFQHEFLGPFVIKQPAKRRDKFDEILGIDTWRKTFNETKLLASAIKSKIEVLNSGLGPLKDQIAVLPDKREELKIAKQGLEQSQRDYLLQQQGLKKLEVRLVEIDKCEQLVKTLKVEIEKLKERTDNGREKIDRQKELIIDADKAQRLVNENSEAMQAFDQVEKRLIEMREQLRSQRQLEQEIAGLDKQVGTLAGRFNAESRAVDQTRKELSEENQKLADKRKELAVDERLQQLSDRLAEIRASLSVLRKQLGQLDGRRSGLEEGNEKLAEGICPFFQETCLNIAEKPPEDVFSGKFAELDSERQRLNTELLQLEKEESEATKASEQCKAIEVQLKGLEDQIVTLVAKQAANELRFLGLDGLKKEQAEIQQLLAGKQQELSVFSSLQNDIVKAEAEQKKYQAARDIYLANRDQASKLEQLKGELQKFEKLLLQLQEDLTTRETELKTLSLAYDEIQHQELRAEKDSRVREVGALGQKVEGLKADVTRLSAEIEKLRQLENEIAEKKAQIKAYGEKEELVKFLRNRVFRNVSASLSERFREEISQRANQIYRVIAEVDEELYWGENYQIVLRDMVEGELRERADDQLSGGQTMSAVVALRLAMLQTIGARIAFFDEPTSNLDATRRENLARAFRSIDVGKEELTDHWYDQLFLISHDVAFTEVTDQIIHLEPGR